MYISLRWIKIKHLKVSGTDGLEHLLVSGTDGHGCHVQHGWHQLFVEGCVVCIIWRNGKLDLSRKEKKIDLLQGVCLSIAQYNIKRAKKTEVQSITIWTSCEPCFEVKWLSAIVHTMAHSPCYHLSYLKSGHLGIGEKIWLEFTVWLMFRLVLDSW